MDRYFKACKHVLPMSDLHIIGVVSMFLASKYEDVIPLSLKIVYNKVGHKKLSTDQILSREIEVLEALEFNLMRQTTLYEQIERLAEEHLKDDYKGLRKYYNYYARLVQFDYETLNIYTTSELAVSILWVAVEVLEKRKKRTIRTKTIFSRLLEMAKVSEEQALECCEAIRELKKCFGEKYVGMKNLNRFCSFDLDALSA